MKQASSLLVLLTLINFLIIIRTKGKGSVVDMVTLAKASEIGHFQRVAGMGQTQ